MQRADQGVGGRLATMLPTQSDDMCEVFRMHEVLRRQAGLRVNCGVWQLGWQVQVAPSRAGPTRRRSFNMAEGRGWLGRLQTAMARLAVPQDSTPRDRLS